MKGIGDIKFNTMLLAMVFGGFAFLIAIIGGHRWFIRFMIYYIVIWICLAIHYQLQRRQKQK